MDEELRSQQGRNRRYRWPSLREKMNLPDDASSSKMIELLKEENVQARALIKALTDELERKITIAQWSDFQCPFCSRKRDRKVENIGWLRRFGHFIWPPSRFT